MSTSFQPKRVAPTHTIDPSPNQQFVTHPSHYATQSPLPLTTQEIPSTSIILSLNLEEKVLLEEEAVDRQPKKARPIRNI